MKKFEAVKKEYMSISASEELRNRVNGALEKPQRKYRYAYRFVASAACVCLTAVAVFNVFPSIAYSMQDIPVVGKVVSAVTFTEYEHNEQGFTAKVEVPQIEGLLDKELQNKLNSEFKENASYVISAFEQDMKKMKDEFGEEEVHLGITSSYIVKTDNEDILALDVYLVNEVGSSSTKHTYYTIDKKTGSLLSLEALFEEGTDYVQIMSDYIKEEMKRRNAEENAMFWIDGESGFPPFEKIDKSQNFYINDSGNIVICFDKYDVAPGAQGSPEFVIPKDL